MPEIGERLAVAYGVLLCLYPPDHRAAYGDLMQTHARDLLRAARGRGRLPTLRVGWLLLCDTLTNVYRERIAAMKKRISALDVSAAVLLLPGALFVALALLVEYVGVRLSGGPLYGFYHSGSTPWLNPGGVPLVVWLGLLSVLLGLLSVGTRVRTHWGQPGLLTAVLSETSPLTLAVVAASLLVMGVMFTYALAENWHCLIGAAAAC